jgi:hypothetical protein
MFSDSVCCPITFLAHVLQSFSMFFFSVFCCDSLLSSHVVLFYQFSPVPCHLFSDKLLSSRVVLFFQSFFLTLSPVLWQTSVQSFGSVQPTVHYPCLCPVTTFCLAVVHFCESCFLSLCTVLWQPCQPFASSHVALFCQSCSLSLSPVLLPVSCPMTTFFPVMLSCSTDSVSCLCPAKTIHLFMWSFFANPVCCSYLLSCDTFCLAWSLSAQLFPIPVSCPVWTFSLCSYVVLSTNSVFCLLFCDNCLLNHVVLLWNAVPCLFLLSCDNLLSNKMVLFCESCSVSLVLCACLLFRDNLLSVHVVFQPVSWPVVTLLCPVIALCPHSPVVLFYHFWSVSLSPV